MKLYNTLTRKVEQVTPLKPPQVTVYTCGPTVYDYPHIGNWFTFIRYDLLVRALKTSGLKPKWVMNITDVGHLASDADEGEDKLEKGAQREGKSAWEVAKFYAEYFENGLKRLNFTRPDYLPKATEHIAEQIDLIKQLEAKGYIYTTSDGVYYDTNKFPGYAAFARLDLDNLQEGVRVDSNPDKRNPGDFALWKFSPTDHQRDMEWDSPWGKGFPGWHLECSAMAIKYLGETLDIHAGGIDHVPVHHTNEIAQSEAVTGKRFANYWMHANHISVNDQKISKSLGNGITLEDIEAKGYGLDAFRLHVLESHYRSQSKLSWASLEAAQNRLEAYTAMADHRWQPHADGKIGQAELNTAKTAISEALLDDLNTPLALAALSQLEGAINNNSGIAPDSQTAFSELLKWLDDALGLQLSNRSDISDEQKQLISEREQARANQDWPKADKLRKHLAEQGIGLRDAPYGQVWFRL